MNRLIKLGIIIHLFIIGGCGMGENNPEKKAVQGEGNSNETPKAAALQDEFTKGYLISSEETDKGYFTFKSKIDGYTMLFPSGALISEDFGNEKRDDAFEAIMYGYKLNGASISTRITYQNKPSTQDIEEKQRLLSVAVGYEGTFEEIKAKGKTIYFAKKTAELKNSNGFVYFSFIKAENSDQAVEFIFNTRCKKEDKTCNSNVNDLENTAIKIMKSVQFEQE
ncbi:hypothetical protein GKZ89_16830 [Bacillus mangrovi]|uniref:Lipoprotein YvcA n=1 Tax=Metabacillus mangrovi TaxID=1491830 RepID=A0A7X2S9C3_9BACI|nr:hypothetical protein [Metabacillus mangrovi]MTH55071.1 hypothetical protein [Metabacillus mangrovi]